MIVATVACWRGQGCREHDDFSGGQGCWSIDAGASADIMSGCVGATRLRKRVEVGDMHLPPQVIGAVSGCGFTFTEDGRPPVDHQWERRVGHEGDRGSGVSTAGVILGDKGQAPILQDSCAIHAVFGVSHDEC